MGIKNLLKFLSQYENILKEINDDELKYKYIAIDISIILYKVIIAIRNSGADLTNNKGEIVSHILGLFNKTIYLLKKNIIPIYVFDGKPPKLKNKIIEERKQIKQKAWRKFEKSTDEKEKIKYFKRTVSISSKQLNECKELLRIMGISYIDALEEADSQCAWLVKNGYADGVLTEDMDILTFGAKKIYRNLGSFKKETLEINLDIILEKINLNYEQFIELCILFGCDYCNKIIDCHYNKIFEVYSKYKNLNETFEFFKNNKYKVNIPSNLMEIKNYFINGPYYEIENDFNLKKVDETELINLLVGKYGLIKSKIYNKVKYLC
jgi:flap endonuclease-1